MTRSCSHHKNASNGEGHPVASVLDDPRLFDVMARAGDYESYTRWEDQAAQAHFCSRPVRLKGRICRVNRETNRAVTLYSTAGEPDSVLLKACRTRREALCKACSTFYRNDAFHLIAAGMAGGKGVPESVASHPAIFVTLTAPSFGAVHSTRASGDAPQPCHPRPAGERCEHGLPTGCHARHESSDEALGTPICAQCFDYEGAVLFNATASELWRRTVIYTLRALGQLAGVGTRDISKYVRLSYVKVAEFQRRGCVHLHAVIRLDRADDNGLDRPTLPLGADTLGSALAIAARKVSAPYPRPYGTYTRRARWGEQLDIAVISTGEEENTKSAGAVAAYLAKYSVKSSDGGGTLNHRVHTADLDRLGLPPHVRCLVDTALRLGRNPEAEKLRLPLWAHTFGHRGHFLTKSRAYSTTFAALAEIRSAYAKERAGPRLIEADFDLDDSAVVEISQWQFTGMGYTTPGDAWLAQAKERDKREMRSVAREEMREIVSSEAA